jgi:hypothetical protein
VYEAMWLRQASEQAEQAELSVPSDHISTDDTN